MLVCVLGVGGLVLALNSGGSEKISAAHEIENYQTIQPTSEIPASNFLTQGQMVTEYVDDFLRSDERIPVAANRKLREFGRIEADWGTTENPNYRPYGNFGAIVGMRGGFRFERQGHGQRFEIHSIVVRFAQPTAPGSGFPPTSAFSTLSEQYITRPVEPENPDSVWHLIVQYANIGTYEITFYSIIGGGTGPTHANRFIVVVRNGEASPVNHEFNLRVRTDFLGDVPSFPTGRLPRPISLSIQTLGRASVDNLRFLNFNQLRLTRGDSTDCLLETYFQPVINVDNNWITLRFVQLDGINLTPGVYTFRTEIQYTMDTITSLGESVPHQGAARTRLAFTSFEIREPIQPWRFPWWTLLVSLAVLLALGGGVYGLSFLVKRSQDNHIVRLTKSQEEKIKVDAKNIELLRDSIKEEIKKDEEIEFLAEIYNQMDDEENT